MNAQALNPAQPDGSLVNSLLQDPVFEPDSEFDFEDVHDDEDRSIPHGVAMHSFQKPQFMYPYQQQQPQYHQPSDNQTFQFQGDHAAYAGAEQYPPDFGMLANPHGLQNTAWMPADMPHMQEVDNMNPRPQAYSQQSGQSQIVSSRPDNVTDQYGQITPPDDISERFSPPPRGEASQTGSSTQTKLNKSERARNAANQRHAKSKMARKDSRLDEEMDGLEGLDSDDKKERYREKNRMAAAKCRAKKKENVESLEQKHRRLSAQHNMLRRAEQNLREELTLWKTKALQHSECNCHTIQNYNQQMAHRIFHGRAGTTSMLDGPDQAHCASSSSQPESRRPSRQHSIAEQFPLRNHSSFAFAPVTTSESMAGSSGMTASSNDVVMGMSQHGSPE